MCKGMVVVKFAAMACYLQTHPAANSPRQTAWQAALAQSIRCPVELCRLLGLDPSVAVEAQRAAGSFGLLVPRPYVSRIRPGDPTDPLLLQILPRHTETVSTPGFNADPLHEAEAACGPGLLQKYQGRLLMVTNRSCAVHCRFCFRRHFICLQRPEGDTASDGTLPYGNGLCDASAAMRKIAADPSIREVILSGGDPLMLPDDDLARLVGELGNIPHLTRLRVHTRLPVMIPERVTDELLSWLRASRLSCITVVHINHAAEIDDDVAAALGRLIDSGVPVLSQSVLLRGVNDRVETLAELFERLVNLRVIPYYLHQLDAVAGAAHFQVPIPTGLALMAELRARLPGYAVPRYVYERPGAAGKEVLA